MDIKKKIKTSWKFRIIFFFGTLIALSFWQITIPALLLWWFYKKSKFSYKFKKLATIVVSLVIVLIFSGSFITYALDEEPKLVVSEPISPSTVQLSQAAIKGTYSPLNKTVWINGKRVDVSNGNFEAVYQLSPGVNKFKVEVGSWKRAKVELLITRELTTEEKKKIEEDKKSDTEKVIKEQTRIDSKKKSEKQDTTNKAYEENNRKALNGEIVEVAECRDAYYSLMGGSMRVANNIGEIFIPSGILLTKVWTDYLQKQPSVSTAGYFYYPDTDNGCIVGFSINFDSGMKNVYTYKQEESTFVAQNAPAIRLTPWYEKKQEKENLGLTNREQEIYNYSHALNNEYQSQYDVSMAEEKSLTDTAKKYGIIEQEVVQIIDKATMNMIKNR